MQGPCPDLRGTCIKTLTVNHNSRRNAIRLHRPEGGAPNIVPYLKAANRVGFAPSRSPIHAVMDACRPRACCKGANEA